MKAIETAVLEKINTAIDNIKKTNITKQGKNTFSNYDYFTPDQIDQLVKEATKELNLFIKFDLVRDELGIKGVLKIVDLESEEMITYTMASAIPEIKATNVAQQLGGAMTYTKRYMLMNAFDITDNNADFDTTENTKKREEIKITWLTDEQFDKAMESDLKGVKAVLRTYNTATHKMSKDKAAALKEVEAQLIHAEATAE